ncbi:MAG: lipopolysaccharide biosynthesis protein [Treponema sp.]|nr:lipopolysaccharide biosynthesis protein [Treponema sp.]
MADIQISDGTAKEKVFSGVFWKFSERILAQGISFVVSVVLARILMPQDYGMVAMVTIFIAIADVFVSTGFSTALIQKKDASETDFSTLFYCSFLLSLLIYVLLFFCAPYIANFYNMKALTLVVRIFALRLPLSSYNAIQHAFVSRHMIFKRFFFSTLLGTLLSGIVGIFLAYKGFGVWALIGQYFTNSIVDTIVLSITVRWHPRFIFSITSAKNLMNYGWKVLAADLSGTFFNHLRGLIVGKFYSAADLAYYNRGTNISNLLTNNIYTSVTAVLFPALSNESDNLEKVKNMFSRSVRVLSYLIFPLLAGCIAVARPFTLVVFTAKWEESIYFIQIICLVPCIELVGHLSIQGLKATAHTGALLRNELLNKPPYIICLVVGSVLGVKALAVSMLISSAIGTFININAFKKIISYSYKNLVMDLASAVLLSVVMGAAISLWKLVHLSDLLLLIIQIVSGVILYILLSIITKNESFNYVKNLLILKIRKTA